MTTSRNKMIGFLLGFALLGAGAASMAEDLSCYRKLESLRVARDRRSTLCNSGTGLTPAAARCIANSERIYRDAVAALDCSPPALQPKEKSFVKRVTVSARAELVDTGLDLRPECTIGVWTTGLWANTGEATLGAGGFVGYRHPGTILSDGDLASLVGVLSGPNSNHPGNGNDAVVLFPIGETREVDLTPGNPRFSGGPSVGRLFLAMNDVEHTYADNAGSLTVDITVPTNCVEVTARAFASAEWNDTKLAIPAGTELLFSTSGLWSNVPGAPTLTAAGYRGSRLPAQRYAGADFASLLGSLGGTTYAMGQTAGFTVGQGGVLRLGMNDVPGTFADNVGSLSVVIRENDDLDRDGISDSLENRILATFRPFFKFSLDGGEDRYHPGDAVDFVRQSKLSCKSGSMLSQVLLADNPSLILAAGDKSRSADIRNDPKSSCTLHPSQAARKGELDFDRVEREAVGLYGHVAPIRSNGQIARYKVEYWMFFPYNDGVVGIARHDGDWETVQLEVSLDARTIVAVRHEVHGRAIWFHLDPDKRSRRLTSDVIQYEGTGAGRPYTGYIDLHVKGAAGIGWAQENLLQVKCAEGSCTHPIVYVEHSGHAMWPTQYWSWPFTRRHDGDGKSFLASTPPNLGEIGAANPKVPAADLVLHFNGNWGDPEGPTRKDSWVRP